MVNKVKIVSIRMCLNMNLCLESVSRKIFMKIVELTLWMIFFKSFLVESKIEMKKLAIPWGLHLTAFLKMFCIRLFASETVWCSYREIFKTSPTTFELFIGIRSNTKIETVDATAKSNYVVGDVDFSANYILYDLSPLTIPFLWNSC